MKALSIRQPWAHFCAIGAKDIENRKWHTSFRGEFLIHASSWWSNVRVVDTWDYVRFMAKHHGLDALDTCNSSVIKALKSTSGGIIGIATIVDCVTESASPWFMGPYGFVLRDAKPLPFTPMKGALGFFNVPDEIANRLRAA